MCMNTILWPPHKDKSYVVAVLWTDFVGQTLLWWHMVAQHLMMVLLNFLFNVMYFHYVIKVL